DDVVHHGHAQTHSRRVAIIGQRGLRTQRLEQRGRLLWLASLLQTPPFPIERRQADGTVQLEPNGLIKGAYSLLIATVLVEQPPSTPIYFRGQAIRFHHSLD